MTESEAYKAETRQRLLAIRPWSVMWSNSGVAGTGIMDASGHWVMSVDVSGDELVNDVLAELICKAVNALEV